MNLYERTLEAQSQVSQYRSPNLADWIAVIDPVLKAAGLPTIGRDKVEDILLLDKELVVMTSYIVMGCSDVNDLRLPLDILKSDDPVKAAHRHQLEAAIMESMERLKEAQRFVDESKHNISKLEAELLALEK